MKRWLLIDAVAEGEQYCNTVAVGVDTGDLLDGIAVKALYRARAVTDFSYCCYLSDLAVDASCQHQGIGKQLIQKVREPLGAKCKLILLSAPAAVEYYPKIGFAQHPSAWVQDGTKEIL